MPIKKITLLLNCLFRSDAILLPNVSKIKYSTKVTKFYFGAGLILVLELSLIKQQFNMWTCEILLVHGQCFPKLPLQIKCKSSNCECTFWKTYQEYNFILENTFGDMSNRILFIWTDKFKVLQILNGRFQRIPVSFEKLVAFL